MDDFNENQVMVLNALFMVDEIFTEEFKWYKLTDSGYALLRSKSNKKIIYSGAKTRRTTRH